MKKQRIFSCILPLLLAFALAAYPSGRAAFAQGAESSAASPGTAAKDFAGLAIGGPPKFSNQVHQALLLLKKQDLEAFAIVTNYVGRIQPGEHSGMRADNTPPTYEMSDATA